ncbi:MAG: ADP-dependent NAD(P)H-hydrate dehydratase / NAD(P)H-hydrate epimerase [Thermodesulfobacteriota bacterium]|nr:ADP-dependent NAD(P)H-hydrate dehydratase / NAD(P)H-hydrate epimerase [Thermodesulfobacteriota bacterium]
MYIVTAGEMRAIDKATIELGLPGRILMENAGRGAVQILLEKFPGISAKKIGILAGRGNNGGDGFVIARHLSQKGIDVIVYLLSEITAVKGDVLANLDLFQRFGNPVVEIPDRITFDANRTFMSNRDAWVDAIFGTGLKSDIKGYIKDIIVFINSLKKPVLAVDIPSGIDSDTGQVCGEAICAGITATFGYAKTGHYLYPGAGYSGEVEIIDIGIPPLVTGRIDPKQHLLDDEIVSSYLKPREKNAHKGTNGHLFIVAGSPGKTGAAAMTAMAAMRAGAGLVTLGVPKSLNPAIEPMILEAMTCPLPENTEGFLSESSFDAIMHNLAGKKCLAVGPGLGTDSSTKKLVIKILRETSLPVILDADGLNLLAGEIRLLKKLKIPVIMTPHPGEMARLTGKNISDIQEDRISCARDFAAEFNVHLILKGAGTVIAHPDGRVFINPTGNPGMASGGMGDILTGIIAGLVAQGYPVEEAARIGVYLHGRAGDDLEESMGPFGFLASDVLKSIPAQIGRILTASCPSC